MSNTTTKYLGGFIQFFHSAYFVFSVILLSIPEIWNGLKQPFHPKKSRKNIFNQIRYYLIYPFGKLQLGFVKYFSTISQKMESRFPKGRYNKDLQTTLFWIYIFILLLIAILSPSAGATAQRYFLSELILLTSIYGMMAIALNLQTGYTGIVNFGVIFFVGIGAVTTSILQTRYNVPPLLGMVVGMVISGFIGFLLAYPSLRLREDYFAIVTIAMGEFLRILMLAEPFFQTKQDYGNGIVGYSVGIANIKGPLKDSINTQYYIVFLSILALIFLILIYKFANYLLYSPYGRVLKGIREDDKVVEAYGYNVFNYKASVLAIGGALFAIPGAFLAWQLGAIFPGTFIVTTTFFVWGAFIIGGKGNNKGMIVGAFIIILTQRVVRQLSNVNRSENFIIGLFDKIYQWFVVDIGGSLFGNSSWQYTFTTRDQALVSLNFLQIFLVGAIIAFVMIKFEAGLIPEEPYYIHKEGVDK